MSDEFTQPLRGDKFEAAEFDGKLLLFFPTEYHSAIPTQHGDNAAVDTHIVDLESGQVLRDARVWGRALIPQLKGAIGGKPVLGRLGRGQATKGNNPPWVLKDFTDQDAGVARQYLSQHGDLRNSTETFTGPPTSNGSAGTATAGAVPPQAPAAWQNVGAATAVPSAAPGAPAVASHDPNLVAQLVAKGVDLSKLPPGTDLNLLLAAL